MYTIPIQLKEKKRNYEKQFEHVIIIDERDV